MPKVAIIAPQFLPCSYPPTHRVRFFAKHLPEFGWAPVIFCVDHRYMEEPADAELVQMVAGEFRMETVKALPASWTRTLGVGDLGIRCFPYMLRAARKLCRREPIDLLFIPGPPWHTFLVGRIIKREFSIPYVMDYIDPWVCSLGENDPPWTKAFWFRQMALLLEPWALAKADHVVAVSDGTNDGVRQRYPKMHSDMFTGIPYGGEPSDFDYLRAHPRTNPYWDRNDGCAHLVYVGAMLPKGYETLRAVFAACLRLREMDPDAAKRLRLHFFGTTYDPNPKQGLVEPVACEMGVQELVSEHPRRIPYLEANNLLCQAHGILAMGTTEHHYTASKIFPNLLANRPLLAVYHEKSTVVDFVEQAGRGPVITYSDDQPAGTKIEQITQRLREILTGPASLPELGLSRFEGLTARAMAERLVRVFDGVLERRKTENLTPAALKTQRRKGREEVS